MAETEHTMSAWVVATSPLTVLVAGAETACNADKISGLTLHANDKVTIIVRTPQRPMVSAIEVLA
jgi:hypothetical protein